MRKKNFFCILIGTKRSNIYMRIAPTQAYNIVNHSVLKNDFEQNNNSVKSLSQKTNHAKVPAGYRYNADIHFGEYFDPNRTVPTIDYEEYVKMTENTKERYRRKANMFSENFYIDQSELVDQNYKYIPLGTEQNMDEFIKVAKMYAQHKDQPIICLGRSPKWFLCAALNMKDGIDTYKFAAFSGYWYRKDPVEGMRRIEIAAPKLEEEAAYRKYLRRVKCDPVSIVNHYEKTGKKTIITDYLNTGKGATSFLDVLSRYAKELGILDKFAQSFEFLAIGNLKDLEDYHYDDENISKPRVIMPELLSEYDNQIKQSYFDMEYNMFKEMLYNQNANECRSTYYPHFAWTKYNPDTFKTGMVTDMGKVARLKKELKELFGKDKKVLPHFSPAMFDYRNLLNFRILDGLNIRGLLK